MFVPAEGRGTGGWPFALLLSVVVAGVLVFSGADEPPAPGTSRPDVSRADVPAPTLIGGESTPMPTTPQPTPEPVPEPVPAQTPPDTETAWRIDFDVANARRWQQVVFVPSTQTAVPVKQKNASDGPANGSVDVRGAGRLVVHAKGRVPWVSDVLSPPPSGILSITATMADGLAVEGTVVASDGTTPVSEGHIQVGWAAGRDDVRHTSPYARWTKTDANGRFRLAGLNPGRVSLRITPLDKAQGARTHVDAKAGAWNLRIQLKPMGMVKLKIFDRDTRFAPVTQSVRIEYPLELGNTGTMMMSRRGDQEEQPPIMMGLENLMLGKPAVVRIQANGYEPFDLPIELPAQGGVQEHDVALVPAAGGEAVLLLHLRFEGGDAPERLLVQRQAKAASMGMFEPIVDGRIELRVAPGTLAVVLSMDKDSSWAAVTIALREEDTQSGARVERDITMLPGGRLGFSEDPPGSQIELIQGEATEKRWIWQGTKKGDWVVGGGLKPGTWTWRIEGKQETWVGEAEIQVRETTMAQPRVEHKSAKDGAR